MAWNIEFVIQKIKLSNGKERRKAKVTLCISGSNTINASMRCDYFFIYFFLLSKFSLLLLIRLRYRYANNHTKVVSIKNGISDLSSNPGRDCISFQSRGKKTLNSKKVIPCLKIDLVLHPTHGWGVR